MARYTEWRSLYVSIIYFFEDNELYEKLILMLRVLMLTRKQNLHKTCINVNLIT